MVEQEVCEIKLTILVLTLHILVKEEEGDLLLSSQN